MMMMMTTTNHSNQINMETLLNGFLGLRSHWTHNNSSGSTTKINLEVEKSKGTNRSTLFNDNETKVKTSSNV